MREWFWLACEFVLPSKGQVISIDMVPRFVKLDIKAHCALMYVHSR